MKQEQWNEGLNHIDDDLVEEYVSKKDALRKKKLWRPVGAIAACLVLLLGIAALVDFYRVPIWKTAPFSAKDVKMSLRGTLDATATNAYQEVLVPSSEYLDIGDIPVGKYLNIYQQTDVKKELDEESFCEFVDDMLPKVAAAIGIGVPQYDAKDRGFSTLNHLYADINVDPYWLHAAQYETKNIFTLSKNVDSDRKLVIDGEMIQVDQTLSDKEILKSLESIKKKLFKLFDVSFSDAKICRSYGASSGNNAEWMDIYFYDADGYCWDSRYNTPVSDYILVSFDNFSNWEGDLVSDSVLVDAYIKYYQNRVDPKEQYPLAARAEKISIAEAEELLYKGYVFGGHSCPICMSWQEKVSFEDYDFVGFEYQPCKIGEENFVIPFYTFYKAITNSKTLYAKTYVPAIEISGYEEYFESQKDQHK